jgi:sugar-specific transcriptional regulator TrmB
MPAALARFINQSGFRSSMAEFERALEKFGLGRNEVKVYLACLKLGPSTTSEIRKKTALPESTAKDNLTFLMKKGLVSRTFLKITHRYHYATTDPQKLADHVKQQLVRIQDIIPKLRALKLARR